MCDDEQAAAESTRRAGNRPVPAHAQEGVPWGPLVALSTAGFLAIVTETIPAGLLPELSAGLGVSQSAAGQLVTAYALGSVVAAIPLVAATRAWSRKRVLLLAVGTLAVFNLLTAIAPWYPVILVARLVAGAAAALVWGVLTGYARGLVTPSLQGRALAVTGIGQPVALAGGVPLGTFAASVMAWRWVFVAISAGAVALAVWIASAVPDVKGTPTRHHTPLTRVVRLRGVAVILGVTAAWILSHNVLYTYIAPLLDGSALRLDIGLGAFGVASMAGIALVGTVIDRWLRQTTLLCLTVMLVADGVWISGAGGVLLPLAAVLVWGLAFGGAPVLLQTALADRAGEHTDAAQSMFVTVFNLAVAGGGLLGGVLLAGAGTTGVALAAGLALVAALAAVTVCRVAFPRGPRHEA